MAATSKGGYRCRVKMREAHARYEKSAKGRARSTAFNATEKRAAYQRAWVAAQREDSGYRLRERLGRIRKLREVTLDKLHQLDEEVVNLGAQS